MSLIYNATFDKNTRKLSFEDRAGNEIYSFTVPERAPAVDDITKPLTFRATRNGSSVTLKKNGTPTGDFQTSNDGGNTWTDYTLNTAISLNTGDEVSFRAKADRTSAQNSKNYFLFEMTGKIEAWHNVMSMIRTNDFATYKSVVGYAFSSLFSGCQSLTKAPVLPATTLADSCYMYMFWNCESLAKAPELPATTLVICCYYGMFNGCTSLTKAPELPATTLAELCYYGMFNGCTSLTKAPELPATTLYRSCYASMFNGCTSLTKAPELPITTLSTSCYSDMFNGCTSLTKAPELPATTLAVYCYSNMFERCTSLTKAPELPATRLPDRCYAYMFKGCSNLKEVQIAAIIKETYSLISWLTDVSATGDFYCNPNARIFPSGVSGIPSRWSRFVLGAEDTGNTTAMYHNGATETVMIGTSDYGVCYALQGWAGFKTLSEMHALGYTFGAQSSLTMYHGSDPVSAYSCDANIDDGFTETMYDVGDGKGYLDIATQNANGYTLTAPNP